MFPNVSDTSGVVTLMLVGVAVHVVAVLVVAVAVVAVVAVIVVAVAVVTGRVFFDVCFDETPDVEPADSHSSAFCLQPKNMK